jgi:predicted transcriptional regulator of viral defense system
VQIYLVWQKMAFTTLERWIDDRQMGGRYVFLRSEAIKESGLSAEAVKKALQRLARRGRIAKAKNYFYVIVPLEYATAGAPPAAWFIHDLMSAMGVPYYVALLSAAALFGASHQAPQEFQVMVDRSVRPIKVGRAKLRFFASKFTAAAAVSSIKTPTGPMRVSTPETTVVDLVRFSKSAGDLDHVATVIAELSSSLEPRRLLAAAKLIGDIPNAQRLGYVLEQTGTRRLAEPLRTWIDHCSPKRIHLRTGSDDGREDSRWHVLVDRPLETEA